MKTTGNVLETLVARPNPRSSQLPPPLFLEKENPSCLKLLSTALLLELDCKDFEVGKIILIPDLMEVISYSKMENIWNLFIFYGYNLAIKLSPIRQIFISFWLKVRAARRSRVSY